MESGSSVWRLRGWRTAKRVNGAAKKLEPSTPFTKSTSKMKGVNLEVSAANVQKSL